MPKTDPRPDRRRVFTPDELNYLRTTTDYRRTIAAKLHVGYQTIMRTERELGISRARGTTRNHRDRYELPPGPFRYDYFPPAKFARTVTLRCDRCGLQRPGKPGDGIGPHACRDANFDWSTR